MCVSQNAHIYNIILLLNSNNYFRLFLLFFVTISQFKTLFHDVEQFYVTSVESQNVKRQNRNLRFRPSFSSPIQLRKNPRCRKSNRHDKDPGMLLHPAAHILTRVNHRRLSLRRIEQKHKNLHGKERCKMSAPVRVDHEHRHKTQLA